MLAVLVGLTAFGLDAHYEQKRKRHQRNVLIVARVRRVANAIRGALAESPEKRLPWAAVYAAAARVGEADTAIVGTAIYMVALEDRSVPTIIIQNRGRILLEVTNIQSIPREIRDPETGETVLIADEHVSFELRRP